MALNRDSYRNRWRRVTGIPVEAAFLRSYERQGGPLVLGYPITPGLYLADLLIQYFNHARLELPGRSSQHPLGLPRPSELGTWMARGLLDEVEPLAQRGEFADPWFDPRRRAAAGVAVSEPVVWRDLATQWHEREIVRLMPVSPGSARPVPGNLGDLYVSLTDAQRARGEGRESPVRRPAAPDPQSVIAPVLTYHLIRGATRFRIQLQALLDAGFNPVSLDQLIAAVEGRAALPERPLVITFDDGWAVQLAEALPVLRELRVPATFFVLPGFERYGQGHMSLEGFRELRAAGMSVASHTLNHAGLPQLIASDLGAAQAEAVESRQILERDVDGVDFIAYPNGRFDTATRLLVRDAGYRAALSTVPGIVHTPERIFELRRVAVQAWWPFVEVRGAIREAARIDGVSPPL